MPPKRKDIAKDDGAKAKKLKNEDEPNLLASITPNTTTSTTTQTTTPKITTDKNDTDSGGEDEGKPWCQYGIGCYRKNPDHFKNFRHPTSSSKKSSKGPKVDHAKPTTDKITKDKQGDQGNDKVDDALPKGNKDKSKQDSTENQTLENYKNVLQCALAKNKISVDEKRMLRTYRRNHDIDDVDHFRLIQQFGWTADEYDDGQRKDDDCDLDEERALLEKGQLTIISIKKAKNMSKEHDIVFSRVCARFFQTMSKAQSNHIITEVGIIVNSEARKKFNLKKQEFTTSNLGNLEWAFHGTTRDSIKAIAETGFLHPGLCASTQRFIELRRSSNKIGPTFCGSQQDPQIWCTLNSLLSVVSICGSRTPWQHFHTELDDLKKLTPKASGKQAKAKKVKLLDEGFFGKGIYLSFYADYAMYYSEERKSDQVLLSQVLPGKTFKCSGRMDGADCQKGYHSHYSPKGNEMVVFDPVQILPRYIITFATNPDQEREQEV